jgi:YegS/Rv2252/BmrU family lipid kinase
MKRGSRKIAFIVNPNAAKGSTGKEWPRIKTVAENRLGPFQAYITAKPTEATQFARMALRAGAGLVICVGGDGTLNEVVNGFMGEDGHPVRPAADLGFIPSGTGCDFRRSALVPRDVEEALDLISSSEARPIDLGRLEFKDHNGTRAQRYFLNVTSFGLGGEVDERVNRGGNLFGGFVSFIWATLVSLLVYHKKHIRLKVDAAFDQHVTIWNVAVANGQYHGGGMWVAPAASLIDGLFHVTVVGDLSLPEVFRELPNLYNGKIYQVKKVRTVTGKRVEAYSDQHVLLDVDGEQPGRLPAVFEMVSGTLRFITGIGRA